MDEGKDVPRWMYFSHMEDYKTRTWRANKACGRHGFIGQAFSVAGLLFCLGVWVTSIAKGYYQGQYMIVSFPIVLLAGWLIPVLLLQRYFKRLNKYVGHVDKK